MTTATLPERAPTDTTPPWLCDCSLSDRILCRLREERELAEQFRLARTVRSIDADVLAHDLRSAGQAIDRLLVLARTEGRQ